MTDQSTNHETQNVAVGPSSMKMEGTAQDVVSVLPAHQMTPQGDTPSAGDTHQVLQSGQQQQQQQQQPQQQQHEIAYNNNNNNSNNNNNNNTGSEQPNIMLMGYDGSMQSGTPSHAAPSPQQLQELMSHTYPQDQFSSFMSQHQLQQQQRQRHQTLPPIMGMHPSLIPPQLASSSSGLDGQMGTPGMLIRPPATSRNSKGLRHFSMKVCEKVQQRGTTTYNDVAEELVRDMEAEAEEEERIAAGMFAPATPTTQTPTPNQTLISTPPLSSTPNQSPIQTPTLSQISTPIQTPTSTSSQEAWNNGKESASSNAGTKRKRGAGRKGKASNEAKNIRRRVYDALNVLMALKIITKDKKKIHWRGYPVNYQREHERLTKRKREILRNITMKQQQLQELSRQQRASRHLFERNSTIPEYMDLVDSSKVLLPFIIVHTGTETVIECQMDEDGVEVFFNFSLPFEIHDDNEILYRLKLDQLPVVGGEEKQQQVEEGQGQVDQPNPEQQPNQEQQVTSNETPTSQSNETRDSDTATDNVESTTPTSESANRAAPKGNE